MCVSKTYKKNIIISVKRLKKSALPFVFQNGIADFFKLCCKYNRQTKYKNKTSKPKYVLKYTGSFVEGKKGQHWARSRVKRRPWNISLRNFTLSPLDFFVTLPHLKLKIINNLLTEKDDFNKWYSFKRECHHITFAR